MPRGCRDRPVSVIRDMRAPVLLIAVLTLAACERPPTIPQNPESPEEEEQLGPVTLTVLYTNDEHGWISPSEEADGAAKLTGVWRDVEGYDEETFLVLSGGDNWTGPAISTWFAGASTVEVMNAMGYDGAAIGNHEFDFGVDALRERIAEAAFPYLSSNIRFAGDTKVPDFATPYVVQEVAGVRVGIVGLTTQSTPRSTFPTNVIDYAFISYAEALREWVPRAWDDGADLVLVIGHICQSEMESLVPVAVQLRVTMIGGGHCNQLVADVRDGVALIMGGWQMAHYAKLAIEFDTGDGTVRDLIPSYSANVGGAADPAVAAVVDKWEDATAAELGTTLGFASATIDRNSWAMYNLITDSWRHAYPPADIVMTNSGGIRQSIPAGDITRETIVGVLPFVNNLIEVELTGSQVIGCLGNLVVGGMSTIGGYFHDDSTPVQTDSVYRVLTTDYLYARDDHCFQHLDDSPFYTGLTYAQPTMDYIEFLQTSPERPLNDLLDTWPRRAP